MFDLVAKHKRVIQIFLALLALTFMTWGIESYTSMRGSSTTVAKVNGMEVSQREFQEELQRQQDQLRRMFGRGFDPSVLDSPETRQALLDGIIAQKLVTYTAYRSNLVVSDDLLVETIHSIPAFQSNGKFDKQAYELALRSQNPPLSPAAFEARLRNDLSLQQLASSVGGTGIAPRTVSSRLAALESQKREVSEARIPAQQFMAQVKVDEGKLKEYYEANLAEFRAPERVRAEYVLLSADALAKLEPATEAEIKTAYDALASRFKVDEQRRASHILVKTKDERSQPR
jgi:peptidyl-prolyl cis-trans isomerase D